MNAAERGMSLGLRALNRVAGLELLDRVGMRDRAEALLYSATKNGFRAGRERRPQLQRRGPEALRPGPPGSRRARHAVRPHADRRAADDARGDRRLRARAKLRPAALDADDACAAPEELLAQANELGVTMLGVPERARRRLRGALGGHLGARRRAARPRRHGPRARDPRPGRGRHRDRRSGATPTSRRTYLARVRRRRRRRPPRSRCSSRGALFDPFELETKATAESATATSSTAPSRSSRAPPTPSSSSIAAELEGRGPALFIVEATDGGHRLSRPSRRWACAPPAPARLRLRRRQARPRRACSATATPPPTPSASASRRLGWCALAVGTAQAALDYVDPVRQRAHRLRRADLPPPGGRLQRRRHRDRARGHAPRDLPRRRAAPTRASTTPARSRSPAGSATTKGMQIGSDAVQLLGGHGYIKEHPVERWYRDLRAAGLMEGALLRLMHHQPRGPEEVRDARRRRRTRSPPRSCARTRASTTSPSTTYPKELDMLAALIDGMNDGGSTGGAGAAGVRRDRTRRRRAATATARTWRPSSA